MKRFKLEQGDINIASHGGLALIGQAIHQLTNLSREVDTQISLRHGIKHSDILKTYLALLCIGKNDFESVNTIENELFFMTAMALKDLPSEPALRLRMDKHAKVFLPIIEKANRDFLINSQATLTPVTTGHIPIDADVTPMDNSGSHKEGVSRTYKDCDGYAPMPAYLGQEGYCLAFELREGKQHCQKGTPAFLQHVLKDAQQVTDQPLLLRLDSGNDAIENIDVVLAHNKAHPEQTDIDFLIKWNPRQQDKDAWLSYAEQHARWETPRPGKRVAHFSVQVERTWCGYDYSIRRVMRLVERSIDRTGQQMLIPELELEGWWTSLEQKEEEVIQLYCDHGTSEQYHSEFKTDMDIERLPSGKFATNALILGCSMLAYNILRWIGQNGLLGPDSPKRHKAKRRRIKTVMQELMYVAVRLVQTARTMKLVFACGNRCYEVFSRLYQALAYG